MSPILDDSWPSRGHMFAERGLDAHGPSNLGAFSPAQNRAILILGVTCASISLLGALLALRWFVLMRRSFRHHLILFLILSDAFKSVWYFVYPIVVFVQGNVSSSSKFCQASGFFLALGLEASDYAILVIALHAILHIFQPLRNIGDGGLHPYRRWIYAFWVALPALAASLAFINSGSAYVTSGTFCYLPKRPFWYRLALAWIPRYLIFTTIFAMYATIYLYVRIKFKGFSNLALSDSRYGSRLESEQVPVTYQGTENSAAELTPKKSASKATQASRMPNAIENFAGPTRASQNAPWENVNFITAKNVQDTRPPESHGITYADFAPEKSSSSAETEVPAKGEPREIELEKLQQDDRKGSEVPTLRTNYTGDTATTEINVQPVPAPRASGPTDQLNATRIAIRRQLRFLFIYPVVYLLMWTFPFASHCLQYSDYYTAHPPFWLSVVTTCTLALQAGADCLVFSWREKPWRRIDETSPFSMHSMLVHIGISHRPAKKADVSPESTVRDGSTAEPEGGKGDSHWWEAEGMKRKDSVWLGTDTMHQIISRQEAEERESHGNEE